MTLGYTLDRADVIVYDEDGRVLCDPFGKTDKSEMFEMVFDGYEPVRRTLKYRCAAAVYGMVPLVWQAVPGRKLRKDCESPY